MVGTGMLREKLTYLIKALPKTFRRVCVPVPEFVTVFLEQNKVGQGVIERYTIKQVLGTYSACVYFKITIDDWTEEMQLIC